MNQLKKKNSLSFCLRVPCKCLNFNKPNNLLFSNTASIDIYTKQL